MKLMTVDIHFWYRIPPFQFHVEEEEGGGGGGGGGEEEDDEEEFV
jgi:hypothetical protein